MEHARRLLEDTADGVERISRASGYGTPEAMRRAFVKTLGTAPAEYRRRFRPHPLKARQIDDIRDRRQSPPRAR